MNSLTQAQIAKKYSVSRPTVSRWVELTKQGKYNLQLDLSENKVKILDNPNNEAELQRLVKTASRYQIGNDIKKNVIEKSFYELFNEEELAEIFTDLKYGKKINLKYTYKNIGAKYWDMFYSSGVSKITRSVDEMMGFSYDEIIYHLNSKNKKFNLIDIGPGNAYPVKDIINYLYENEVLSKYICIDISKEINEIAKKNLNSWFPNLKVIAYERDMESSKIASIVLGNKAAKETNIILYIGNTLGNHDDRVEILKHLRSGMTPEDVLITTFTLNVPENRAVLNYVKSLESDLHQGWIPEMLGIDLNLCEVVVEYNSTLNSKTKGFKLDKDYEIEFRIGNRLETIHLKKNEIINTWKHYLVDTTNFIEEMREAELEVISLKTDVEGQNAMSVSKVNYKS